MRVLDLGCGRALSSIFLRKEFEVEVWAVDLWSSASENLQRIRDADVEHGVYPIHAEARSLPFANDFFDAIISIDSFPYFGTDDLYLSYLSRFVKPDGQIAIAGAGLMREQDAPPQLDLIGARQTIDSLSLLSEKTKGNLTPVEQNFLQNALYEMRMAYVEVTNAIAKGPQQVPAAK
jgi:ubiquinone/menaquinone biosynthesis C-methylase UbiE